MTDDNATMPPISEHQLELVRRHQEITKPRNSLVNAAVSIVLRNSINGPEFLLIQRAKHENDPWSGQMAFPGGKYDKSDQDYKDTAIRETKEEINLNLHDEEFIGQIDDVYGLKANGGFSVHVACYVFKIDRKVTLKPNYEVADLVWLPFSFLETTQNAYEFYHPHDASLKMPAILINAHKDQVLWGLSLRMLFILYTILGHPMNALSAKEKARLAAIEQIKFK